MDGDSQVDARCGYGAFDGGLHVAVTVVSALLSFVSIPKPFW
ncbi:hypothetical protein VCR29J2_70124 [Vibrio coralliirubri]|nr:hypothetical protein VCR29J2_70124 [Vibrio coralliirubri]